MRSVSPPWRSQGGEGVPKQLGVQVLDAGVTAPAAEELRDAGGGHAPLAADPEPLRLGMWVTGEGAEVLVERLARLVAERQGALAAALCHHDHHVVLESSQRPAASRRP